MNTVHCTDRDSAITTKAIMQIVGVGTDIIECVRIRQLIERHGEVFLTRVFTEREISYCQSRRNATEHFAGRFAAKEAVLKCLGTGMSKGLCWTEIEVRNEPNGQPKVTIHGATREITRRLKISDFLISISHCRSYATAFATAVADDDEE
jgi:holo-[acyl-carrier protein] synthase